MKKILVLGAGTGGVVVSNLLRNQLNPREWSISVIDQGSRHVYQPGLLFLPFGLHDYRTVDDISRPIRDPLSAHVDFVNATIQAIDHDHRQVDTSAGRFDYDWLISAMGCRVAPEEVDGLSEAFDDAVHTFYTPDSALRLRTALSEMQEGRLVIDVADMPIKCPVAPLEFAFLADAYFESRGLRDRVTIELVTPLSGAFTKPIASAALSGLAEEKAINILPEFSLAEVDGAARTISSFDGRSVEYDLLVSIPPNLGPSVLDDSGLGDGTGFGLTDRQTLKSRQADRVYFIGDNANVPTSKAGSAIHFQAETVVDNILREIGGRQAVPSYDGHVNCFIESGHNKALLIDFNYDVEPLQGDFPVPHLGPFTLLRESRVNHLGKLAFRWVYWHLLLGGHMSNMPLLPSHMSFFGKDLDQLPEISKSHQTHIREMMTTDAVTVPLGTTLRQAAGLMSDLRISSLPVVDPDARLVGVITATDFVSMLHADQATMTEALRKAFSNTACGETRAGCLVDDVMTPEPITLREDASLHQAVEAMKQHHVHQVVVTDEARRVKGILSSADLVRVFH